MKRVKYGKMNRPTSEVWNKAYCKYRLLCPIKSYGDLEIQRERAEGVHGKLWRPQESFNRGRKWTVSKKKIKTSPSSVDA